MPIMYFGVMCLLRRISLNIKSVPMLPEDVYKRQVMYAPEEALSATTSPARNLKSR